MGRKLTAKQATFVQLVATGKHQTDAYLEAYDADGMSRASARAEASKLARNVRVARAVRGMMEGDKDTRMEVNAGTEEWVRTRLQDEATDLENPPASRIRALELLGKAKGMFTDKVVVDNQARSVEELEAEIARKLGEMYGQDGGQDTN